MRKRIVIKWMRPWSEMRYPDIEAVFEGAYNAYMCYGPVNILGATKTGTTYTHYTSKQTTRNIRIKHAKTNSS